MDPPARYYDLIREMKNAFNHRLRLVDYARQHGLKAAARAFRCTPPTLHKWLPKLLRADSKHESNVNKPR